MTAPTFRLVRLSPAHPLWHLERVGADRTECGREWREPVHRVLGEPLPTPRCSVCAVRMEAHLSRAGARAAHPGPPTSSSPAARGAGAPDGVAGAPALDAQSEAEVSAGEPRDGWTCTRPSASDLHPSRWRPAFVDNDARAVPTTWEPMTVKDSLL